MDLSHHLWQAKIYQHNTSCFLTLTFHHSIFGGSCIQDLLSFITSNLENDKELKTENSIPSAIESLLPENICFSALKSTPIKPWSISRPCEASVQKTRNIFVNLNGIDVLNIKMYAKKNNFKINPLLNALALKSLALTLNHPHDIILHSPVNLLKYTSLIHHPIIGCFIGIVHTSHHNIKSDDNLIELACNYEAQFKSNLASLFVHHQTNYNRLKDDLIKKFNKINRWFLGGLAVSNSGSVELPKEQSRLIKNVFYTSSLLGGQGIMVLHLLSYQNIFNLVLTYTEPLIEKSFIELFASKLRQEFLLISK
jgi:hypothetical protein